ncbi:hypothetical protein J4G37_44810, partial [Microvirga sp. 3-52]|nr:hypothetical protein [Microvirga sp. 3-52]
MTKLKGKRLWWLSVSVWIGLTIILSALAPGGKEFVQANKDAGLPADVESIIADRQLDKHFPQDGGMPIFAVFHKEEGVTDEEIDTFADTLEGIGLDEVE